MAAAQIGLKPDTFTNYVAEKDMQQNSDRIKTYKTAVAGGGYH